MPFPPKYSYADGWVSSISCFCGTNIQRRMYNNKPVPQISINNANIRRQVQEGTGVCSPRPPHTPPIQRSFCDLVKFWSQFFGAINYLLDFKEEFIYPVKLDKYKKCI